MQRTPGVTADQVQDWTRQVPACRVIPATPDHMPFLHDLFVAVQNQQMGPLPLPETAIAQMLSQQFAAQHSSYRQTCPAAADFILEVGADCVGRVLVDMTSRPIHVLDIAILPRMQSRGIGSAVLRAICDAARDCGTDVTMKVLAENRASQLYARLGFAVVDTCPPHLHMLWRAPQVG